MRNVFFGTGAAVLVLGLIGCAEQAAEGTAETEAANKLIVERYWDGKWNARNPEILDELQSPDVVYHGPGHEMRGLQEYKQVYGAYLSAFHDTQAMIEELIAEGDKVMSRVVLTGVHGGDLPDLPATGRSINFTMFTIFRIVDGKIVEEWESYDELSMMQQLGAM
jgi:steroid delta-isomerase-like uncharacterized protein